MDDMDNIVHDNGVVLIDGEDLRKAMHGEAFAATARFYIDGESLMISGVGGPDSQSLLGTKLRLEQFSAAVASTIPAEALLREAGLA